MAPPMAQPTPRPAPEHADPYHGFSLGSVCWGYRELFGRIIADLLDRGLIGPERRDVTAVFFSMLRQADQGSYDHVLRRFLGAINPRTEWLLDVPAVFADVVDLGREYAAEQPHRGAQFFAILAEGGLGQSPEQVHRAVAEARRLRGVDEELSLAFLRGYARLAERLLPPDIGCFIEAGLAAFRRQPPAGLAFMEGTLESAETLIRSLARECRLQDVHEALGALLQALAGRNRHIAALNRLSPDDVEADRRGSVCLGETLYLPSCVRRFDSRVQNRSWYTLATVVAAAALGHGGFSRIHGHARYRSLRDLVGTAPLALNALLLAEWSRVLARCTEVWPGARRLVHAGLASELRTDDPDRIPAVVHQMLLGPSSALPAGLAQLREVTHGAINVFHTAELLSERLLGHVRQDCPVLAETVLPPLSFVPDDLFAGAGATPPGDRVVADLRQDARRSGPQPAPEPRLAETDQAPLADDSRANHETGETTTDAAIAAYPYDEWSQDEHDYRRHHCRVHETVPTDGHQADLPPELAAEARRVRRAFERFRPETVRRERFLRDGDEINHDRLVHFLIEREVDPSPRVDFYEKPRINRRDLAVLVLLDVSGSTGELTSGGERILDLERRATYVLGQGLAALGDRFAICGFHSNGPRHCSFLVFKDFEDGWDRGVMARLQAALPADSTRIGPALRHAGWRLERVPCRQRLVLLITDGRPMDTGYDPNSRYAHHDVRKACEENARLGIHTFGVSTEANSLADMEIMFPGHRFVILPDLRDLPRVLPVLYGRLTL